MLSKLKMFLKSHKNNFFVKIIIKTKKGSDRIFGVFKDRASRKCLKRLQKKLNKVPKEIKLNSKINVVFLIANSNTWNKLKPLYDEMLFNEKINVKILCCPEPLKEDTTITYNFFVNNGYDCIDARTGNGPWNAIEGVGEWFDLKILSPDYVFYSEPYNHYLPKEYRSHSVSKYAKVCIVAYGMTTTKEFLKIRPRNFYRDVSLCYANNTDEKEYNISQFKKGHKLKIQQTKYLGFLAFSDIMKFKQEQSESWNFSKNSIRGIWTPRWTIDESLGGSNFFKYKDVLFKYAEENSDFDILFRPHPMALDNFIRTGKMTAEEVAEFKQKCSDMTNVSLDNQKSYSATFWNSSFLITDISSIIVEYFVTGKPIIFCETENPDKNYLPYFAKILDMCYVVNNEEELIEKINMLKSGKDELKESRNALIEEIFGSDFSSVPGRIVNDIIDDFYSR